MQTHRKQNRGKKNTTQCNVASHYMSAMVLDKCARTSSNANIYTRPPNGRRDDSGRTHDFYVYECRVCVCMCGVHGHSILLLLSGKRITVCVCAVCTLVCAIAVAQKQKSDITKSSWRGVIRQQNDKNAGDSILLCNIFVRHSAFLL